MNENHLTEELYSDNLKASQLMWTSTKQAYQQAPEKFYGFVEGNKEALKKSENLLEFVFPVYGYTMFLDYLSSASVCTGPSDEVTPIVANLIDKFGVRNGHLATALLDTTILGLLYVSGERWFDRIAKKIDPRIDIVPLFRKIVPYAYVIGTGIKHYLAYQNNW